MLSINYTEKIVGLQDVIVKKVEENEENLWILVEMVRKVVNCPCCGEATRAIHDYRTQKIKDASAFGKKVTIILKKRRYRCSCGKRFAEPNTFIPRYHRMTHRLIDSIVDKLREERSFTSVARETNLSVSTVIRVFDNINYSKPKVLPQAVGIDEFKGNTGREKYQCIITDLSNGRILDILPKRYEYYLCDYFKTTQRDNVKCFVSDMWRPYSEIAKTYFKNSTYIIDKYHWVRQVTWAFEAVRKEVQKKFSKSHRVYFKRSRTILLKKFSTLTDEQKQQFNIMISASPSLSNAHYLKEEFYEIVNSTNREEAKEKLIEWIDSSKNSGLIPFEKCGTTMYNWMTGILNSFDYPYTNGFTEGCNNKIKVLKRNAYGYRNFNRFRNRILHIFSHKNAA